MELSKQLYREIEELQVKELFRAYNPDHMERKHILVTDGDLLQRLCRIKIEKDEIILCTKFSEPLDEVLNLIHDCILKNTRDIESVKNRSGFTYAIRKSHWLWICTTYRHYQAI